MRILPKSGSHSVWSAWIEIENAVKNGVMVTVALRLECVDRNIISACFRLRLARSHSVWSAWIEIAVYDGGNPAKRVALRLECVDRNL